MRVRITIVVEKEVEVDDDLYFDSVLSNFDFYKQEVENDPITALNEIDGYVEGGKIKVKRID